MLSGAGEPLSGLAHENSVDKTGLIHLDLLLSSYTALALLFRDFLNVALRGRLSALPVEIYRLASDVVGSFDPWHYSSSSSSTVQLLPGAPPFVAPKIA